MTGRIALLGDNLVIGTELTNARDDSQMWGEQYNRRTRDLLSVHSEISREIARELRLTLTTAEQQQLARRETVSPQAYELLLRGQFHAKKGGTENRIKGVEYFNQAIAVDPDYAVAYASLCLYSMILAPKLWVWHSRIHTAKKLLMRHVVLGS